MSKISQQSARAAVFDRRATIKLDRPIASLAHRRIRAKGSGIGRYVLLGIALAIVAWLLVIQS